MLAFSPVAASPLASSGESLPIIYLAATDAKDTSAILIDLSGTVSLSATDSMDIVDGLIGVATVAYLETTDAADTASFEIQNINLLASLVEAADASSIVCTISGTISLTATEARDTYSQAGYLLWIDADGSDDPSIWVPKNDPATYLTTVI